MRKIFNKIIITVFVLIICITSVNAALGDGSGSKISIVTGNNNALTSKFDTAFSRIFGTILNVLKVFAVAGIVIAGVQYMYAGSADKAKIKQSLIYIVIGTILVFATDVFVKVITGAWNDVA